MLPIGLCAQLACIWEASSRKPGNVHRYRDFEDVTYLDFLSSAAAIAPEMEAAPSRPLGETVLAAVRATQQVVSSNTNLGIILLLAPLAAVPRCWQLSDGVETILSNLTVEDSRQVFEAIRLANPAGLGRADAQDIREEPTLPLRDVMALAADRDLIALQYVNGFQQVFGEAVPALQQGIADGIGVEESIIRCQLHLLSRHPDSLIARKRGMASAVEVSELAGQVLCGELTREAFDAWLCKDGHGRNPGTTADAIAAALFVMLREGLVSPAQPFAGQQS